MAVHWMPVPISLRMLPHANNPILPTSAQPLHIDTSYASAGLGGVCSEYGPLFGTSH